MRRRLLVVLPLLLAGLGLTACQDEGPIAVDESQVQASIGEAIPGEWIVVFNRDVPDPPGLARSLVTSHGGALRFTYQHALKGFAASLPDAAVIALRRNPQIAYIEPDRERHIAAQTIPTGISRIFANGNSSIDIDDSDDWRVDADVAIIDTGIDLQHPDLNVHAGVNCTVNGIFFASCTPGGDDDHYHGTHVAGTVGALDNSDGVVGVAPGARVWPVKVLNKRGTGYSSWIIAGIDWVTANAGEIEVANMSLGGAGYSQAEYDAIQGAVKAGVAFAVAAGNNDADANNYSPAAFDNVLTVSALADFNGLPDGGAAPTCRADDDDTLADFSNWGPEVDIAAPGVCILSTYPLEKGGYGTISGTSMASPHVAGALALLASRNNPANETDVTSLYNQVKSAGNLDWTDDSGDGIKERLLDVGSTTFNPVLVAGSGGSPTNQPPTAAFTYSCDLLTCLFTDGSTDTDGSVVSWSWTFGDGTSTAQSPSHTYASSGTFNVTLTVTDDDGATATTSKSVAVTSGGGITLHVTARTAGSNKFADLTWSGASSANVDIWAGVDLLVILVTTANDGAYSYKVAKATTTMTYKLCEAGTLICSNEVTVTW